MVLRMKKVKAGQEDVFNLSGLDPSLGRGCYSKELDATLRRLGFDPGEGWHSFPDREAADGLKQAWEDLRVDLVRRIPSIVCMRFDASPGAPEHFRLVVGYDPGKDQVIYHDPAVKGGAYLRMGRGVFLECWPLRLRDGQKTVIRFRMVSNGLTPPPVLPHPSPADYAQRVMRLRERAPVGFSFRVEPPFVLAGDETPAELEAHAVQTVRWAVDRLRKDFLPRTPRRVLDLWLLEGAASYGRMVRKLTGEEPASPYGFYSRHHGALFMNIRTGSGTLVHEIVHPFMEANFPGCPPWFNEGLGSLFEACQDRQGHMVGLPNWRLVGLQQALRKGAVPPFEALLLEDEDTFYDQDPGTNYAQARYLCYYLQEKGLLRKFTKAFLVAGANDPGGVATLKKILGTVDLEAFQEKWRTFILELKAPRKAEPRIRTQGVRQTQSPEYPFGNSTRRDPRDFSSWSGNRTTPHLPEFRRSNAWSRSRRLGLSFQGTTYISLDQMNLRDPGRGRIGESSASSLYTNLLGLALTDLAIPPLAFHDFKGQAASNHPLRIASAGVLANEATAPFHVHKE